MKTSQAFRALLPLLFFAMVTSQPAYATFEEVESNDTQYTTPKSSFKSSEDVSYFGSENAQTVRHVNVTEDDTRTDNTVKIQERTEFNTETSITVMGNMGSGGAAKIYSSEKLESKTGKPTEKKGVEETPYGYSAHFTTEGTKFIEPKRPRTDFSAESENADDDDSVTSDEAENKTEDDGRPRVLVS